MTSASPPSLASIIAALRDPRAYPHPVGRIHLIETHISFVLLAGAYAYKLKKPVSLDFVDFSSLARRRHFCAEEIRLNRRLAPGLYLDVVSVCDTAGRLRLCAETEEGLEYAVRMRRFPRHATLTEMPIDRDTIDRLAIQIADFHQQAPQAAAESPFGTPQQVLAPMLTNAQVLRAQPIDADQRARVDGIEAWTRERFTELEDEIFRRKREGWIRECHGDLHRGNIALIDGEPTIFDTIEFNPGLRWIDCISDIGFLAMDLRQIDARKLERRLINHYLELTGDYAGLRLLGFYQVYRAMVRAKVCGIRLGQESAHARESSQTRDELDHYLRVAADYTRHQPQRVFIAHGLSGSGKTWLGQALREHIPLIQLRSDVERKRLLRTPDGTMPNPQQLYSTDASRRTYEHLRQLADRILAAGYSVLIDAACLLTEQRALFRDLAAQHHCPFTILALSASPEVLKARVSARLHAGQDASDANAATVIQQQRLREPLTAWEQAHTISLNTQSPAIIAGLLQRLSQDSG